MPKKVTRPNVYAANSKRSMGEMNVTPFIDVLLVLLIMLIMAVPIKLHETSVDLPRDCVNCIVSAEKNTVSITAQDQLLWNGTQVTPQQLEVQIAAAVAMPEEPLLRFEPDAQAGYGVSARTIARIKESGATNFAFVGNHKYAALD